MNKRIIILILCISLIFIFHCSDSKQTSQTKTPVVEASKIDVSKTEIKTDKINLKVLKSPTCSCCQKWIDQLSPMEFSVQVKDLDDVTQEKVKYGIQAKLQSCHTAITENGYVFEGHVPAKFIKQFLKNPPANSVGLSVPGMVTGSPGMEYEDKFTPYQVLLIKKDGSSEVFASVKTMNDQK